VSSEKKKEKAPKPKYNMWQNAGFMIKLAWKEKEKKVLAIVLISALLAVASSLINLYISPMILSTVERKAPVSEMIITIILFVTAMMLCQALTAYINSNNLFGRVTVRMMVVKRINNKAMTTSYSNINDEKFIKLLGKSFDTTNSNDKATEAIWGTLESFVTNCLGFLLYLMLLSSVNIFMVAVILITTIIGYYINKKINTYEYVHRDEVADYEKKMQYIRNVVSDYNAAKDIRIFGLKAWLEELYAKSMKLYMAFHKRVQCVYITTNIIDIVLAFVRNGIAYIYLINLVLENGLTAAEFLLYFSAVGGFSSWVTGILGNLSTLHKQGLDLSNVRECLEYPEAFKFESGEAITPDNTKKYELKLENVSFRYPESDKDILKSITLTLHPGEKLAVVGLNGAGKTTLVKLMCGYLDPTEGRVLLDGKDIRDYNRRDYYRMFSAVFQEFSLLAGSIAMNVAQTDDNIDMERVKACIADAGLGEKVKSLEKEYETLLNREIYDDAIMLSGGETQRLMLARALYKDAPFIMLDEPTAALDPIAESDMYKKYNDMTKGKSSVYISHRLASTRFCDRIILLEGAGIVEEGTHEDLLKLNGRYAELFGIQSKYYKEGSIENE